MKETKVFLADIDAAHRQVIPIMNIAKVGPTLRGRSADVLPWSVGDTLAIFVCPSAN